MLEFSNGYSSLSCRIMSKVFLWSCWIPIQCRGSVPWHWGGGMLLPPLQAAGLPSEGAGADADDFLRGIAYNNMMQICYFYSFMCEYFL